MEKKPFEHLNIETLMPSNNHNYNRNKKLDVFTISDGKKINIEPDRDFNSADLLSTIQERRRKLRNWLVDTYNQCCLRIKEANNAGLTDILFELPEIIVENSSYRHKDAIEYISKNLRNQAIDTLILDNKKIFITWKYIELNYSKFDNYNNNNNNYNNNNDNNNI